LLEKAYRRSLGKDFLSAMDYYNVTLRHLKSSGAIRRNIENMGREQGIPEAVWMKISGQCYERTVGPRIEELKKYEAFSDSVYGELLPPFVAHIASLTGLKEDSVLVDMGSGVGNCAVQASLA
jgi:H3 lysine-79-specific histone-lysine N-methyltransferase